MAVCGTDREAEVFPHGTLSTNDRSKDCQGERVGTVTIQRIVFPAGFELPAPASEIVGLYLKRQIPDLDEPRYLPTVTPTVIDRATVRVPQGALLSTDTYFNRVHAGYWRRWTGVETLTVSVGGVGRARMAVRRSTANGYETTVRVVEGDLADGLRADADLAPMAGGGCLWIEVEPLDGEILVRDGRWTTEREAGLDIRMDVAVCTFDRPEDVLSLLRSLRNEQECLDVINQVWVIDNGTKQFTSLPGADEVVDSWGAQLTHVSQPNLGGSGGFARGMFEAAFHGESPYVMLLDDDVVVEPEGLRRAVVFASNATRPIAVGGHMLNRAEPTVLHSSAEWVETDTMRWGPSPGGEESIPLEDERLEYVLDAAFNAWWCCLIPTDAIRKVGLGMPFFIKYDDVEFGYRLARAGFRTVTLPGSAVWHEPWTLKDDTTDWTLYFHVRNRLIFSALMSAGLPEKVQRRRVATVVRDVMKRDIVRNVCGGHTRVRRPRTLRCRTSCAARRYCTSRCTHRGIVSVPTAAPFPTPSSGCRPVARGTADKHHAHQSGPRSRSAFRAACCVSTAYLCRRSCLPIPAPFLAKKSADPWLIWSMPEKSDDIAELPKVADHWWGLVDVPDAWVTTVDGGKVTRRTRTPALSRALTKQAWETGKVVREQFPRLCEEYVAEYPALTSPQAWAKQFGIEVDE